MTLTLSPMPSAQVASPEPGHSYSVIYPNYAPTAPTPRTSSKRDMIPLAFFGLQKAIYTVVYTFNHSHSKQSTSKQTRGHSRSRQHRCPSSVSQQGQPTPSSVLQLGTTSYKDYEGQISVSHGGQLKLPGSVLPWQGQILTGREGRYSSTQIVTA